MERKQFTFYRSFWETIENLPTNREKLAAYQMICAYALSGIEPELSGKNIGAATVFRISKPILSRAMERAKQLQTVNNLAAVPK